MAIDLVPVISWRKAPAYHDRDVSTFLVADRDNNAFESDSTRLQTMLTWRSEGFPRLHDLIRLAKWWNDTYLNGKLKGVFVEICAYQMEHAILQDTGSHIPVLLELLHRAVKAGRVCLETEEIVARLNGAEKESALKMIEYHHSLLTAARAKSASEFARALDAIMNPKN